MSGWLRDYNLTCQPVDYSDSDRSRRVSIQFYYYYLNFNYMFGNWVI